MYLESDGYIVGNLSALDSMLIVWHEYLSKKDKFVLSKSHSAGALYIALWSLGCLIDQGLKLFHKDNMLFAGHPAAQWIEEISFATRILGNEFPQRSA
jgi:transketolase